MSRIADVATDLISFRTTADNPEEVDKCIAYIKDFFHGSAVKIDEHEKNGKKSVVILLKDTTHPQFMMNGHADVVPASPDAFQAKIENGKLIGRGSEDMKGQIAAMMILVQELAHLSPTPSVGLMITFDEEVGGKNGVGYLLTKYSCDIALVPDAGDNYALVEKTKGNMWVKCTAKGKEVHGSRPWQGVNALEILLNAAAKIKEMFPTPSPDDTWKTSANISMMRAGDAPNKTPGQAEMIVDFRYTEETNPDTILEQLMFPDIDVTVVEQGSRFQTDLSNSFVKTFKSIAEKHIGNEIAVTFEHGGIDGRYFSERHIPCIVFKPLGDNAHTAGEWADIESLDIFYNIIKEFALEHITREQ